MVSIKLVLNSICHRELIYTVLIHRSTANPRFPLKQVTEPGTTFLTLQRGHICCISQVLATSCIDSTQWLGGVILLSRCFPGTCYYHQLLDDALGDFCLGNDSTRFQLQTCHCMTVIAVAKPLQNVEVIFLADVKVLCWRFSVFSKYDSKRTFLHVSSGSTVGAPHSVIDYGAIAKDRLRCAFTGDWRRHPPVPILTRLHV